MDYQIDSTEKILTYKRIDDKNIDLIYLPPTKKVYDKSPVFFMISGGGWHTESKVGMYHFSKGLADTLRDNGVAVVSIDYSVVNMDMTVKGDISIAEIVDDVFDALEFVGKNAESLNVDAKKIIVTGHSAGAHLTALVSFADAKLFKGEAFEPSYKIIGAIPVSPITFLYCDGICKKPMEFDHNFIFYNKEYDGAVAHKYSPYDYITENSVPTLFIHGTGDDLVNFDNSYYAYLKGIKSGAQFSLLPSVNGGHSFEGMQGKEVGPDYNCLMKFSYMWLMELLK